ncbi:MAG TPA: dihydrolipoyl dehydrogenase [bacterium]|nr:dihydrolipoyl dehydrogenase [bacterium]
MPDIQEFDLIVIGAGPAGYVAAIRASQLGMKVACVEKERTLGGTCLNVGCIPSKALLESSEHYAFLQRRMADHGIAVQGASVDFGKFMERKDKVVAQLTGGVAALFKKNKVTHVLGQARINEKTQKDKIVTVTRDKEEVPLKARHILIATGSQPISIPGVALDGVRVVDSTGALSLPQIPKKLVIIGGGYIGLEIGSVYLRLGSEVVVLEAMDRIVPLMDADLSRGLHRILEKQGMKFSVKTKVKETEVKKDGTAVVHVIDPKGGEAAIDADVVLMAVGRKPYTEGLGLKEAGVQLDEKGRIVVDPKYQTSVEGIYAVGDVIAGPMLAHKAMEEGTAVVEMLAGQAGHVNYGAIPSVVYTHPEVASVGLTEEEAKLKGFEVKTHKFSMLANGRSIAMGERDGFVKLVADKKTDRLLGAHIIAPRASDMIAELVLAMGYSASAEDIARTCHAHPTLAEAVKEAALGLGGGTIHA